MSDTKSPGPHRLSAPVGAFSVQQVGGLHMPATALCTPGSEYTITCHALCDGPKSDTEMTVAPKETCTARDLARRAQLVATMQHVTRHGCGACRLKYLQVPGTERQLLHTGAPKLGDFTGGSAQVAALLAANSASMSKPDPRASVTKTKFYGG